MDSAKHWNLFTLFKVLRVKYSYVLWWYNAQWEIPKFGKHVHRYSNFGSHYVKSFMLKDLCLCNPWFKSVSFWTFQNFWYVAQFLEKFQYSKVSACLLIFMVSLPFNFPVTSFLIILSKLHDGSLMQIQH